MQLKLLIYTYKQSEKSFFISPILPDDTEALISTLKVHKAVGPGSIPTIILKQFKKLLKPLPNLINLSFSTGLFPKILKLKLFQYLKKVTNKTATITDLSCCYRILVKSLKNLFIGSFMDFLNLTTICIPINLAFTISIQQTMH